MQPNEDEQQLDNQDDKNNQGVPSGDQQDQDQGSGQDQGNQGDDDQGDQDGDQGEHQSRQERRRERFEAFNAAREGFQGTSAQREQVLRRDPYNPLKYDKGTEYDVDDLEKDRNQYGDSRYAQGVEQQRFYDAQERYYDRLETDGDFVANRYPFLDEESDDFDPDLNGTINELFFEAAGYDKKTHVFMNPGVRYKPFVQRYVKAMEKYAATRNAESGRNLETQRGRTGVRPSGAGRKPVQLTYGDPSKMTDEELDAHIAASLK
jgi:hypothetical protein